MMNKSFLVFYNLDSRIILWFVAHSGWYSSRVKRHRAVPLPLLQWCTQKVTIYIVGNLIRNYLISI